MKTKRKSCLSVYLFCILFSIVTSILSVSNSCAADDLVLNGVSLSLSGEHTYNTINILNGGVLSVETYNGTPGTGTLTLKANNIYIDPTSSINADGKGYRGMSNAAGEGPGGGTGGATTYDSGGGGGYGGMGGNGVRDGAGTNGPFDGVGGPAYGSADDRTVGMGSAGGAAGGRDGDSGGYGGNGGGAIYLEAETITNAGLITAGGANGLIYNNDSSGGGSGGGILIIAGSVVNSGTIRANGGTGGTVCGQPSCGLDDGAGGGGGGRIKIFHDTFMNNGTVSVAGGSGSRSGQSGQSGTLFIDGSVCVTPPSGMVGWWTGDGNANDSKGNNQGSVAGGTTYAAAKVGQGFSFDGTGRVVIPDAAALDMTGPLTLDAWMSFQGIRNPTPSISNSPIAAKWGDTLFATGGYGLFIDTSGRPFFALSSSGYDTTTAKAALAVATGVLTHVTGVWTGSEMQLYVNGALIATKPFAGPVHLNDVPLMIGGYDPAFTSGPDSLIGMVDEVEIFNRALSIDEIRSIYYAGSAGKCKNRTPVADAGPDQTVECAGPAGASVILDGSKSSDHDGDTLSYTWSWNNGNATGMNPTITLPLDTTTVTLTVDDGKGGTDQDTVVIEVKDTIPPATIVQSIAGIAGANGWYTSGVTVNLEATDSCSGVKEIHYSVDGVETVVPGSVATLNITPEGTHGISYFAKDSAGNEETVHPLPINIDKTPPTITASAAPAPNANGWNNTDVTVTFTCSDAGSGIAICPSPITVSTEGLNKEISGTAYDKAGLSASTSLFLNIDKTAPIITGAITPAPNADGWNNTAVTVAWTCNDTGSGLASCTAATTLSTEVTGQVVDGEAVDKAGNRATARVEVNIDKTAPIITHHVTPAPNVYGWNNSDVTVSFECTDTRSGIASCPSPVVVTTEGKTQTVRGTTMDKAGNEAFIDVTLNIDKTAPVITINGVTDGATYPVCTSLTPDFTATDPLSGLLSQDAVSTGGNANGVNLFTYTVTASDRAGNTTTSTVTYRVAYSFGGFIPPVTLDRPFKKGSIIPVKFTLTDGCGGTVSSAVASLTLQLVSGNTSAEDPIDATSNVPDSGNLFRYSGSGGIYIYNLETRELAVGTYTAAITTDDGVTRTVNIQIKP